ncbi:MAG: type II CAAX endopeptidase family protein [Candidatus Micrarchaeota archaeon]
MFFASGLLIRFSDARFLIEYDLLGSLLLLAAVELVFRGFVAKRVGTVNATLLFLFVFTPVCVGVLGIGIIEAFIFVGVYGAGMGILSERENAWTCVLAVWVYLISVSLSVQTHYFSSVVLSLLLLSLPVYLRMRHGLRDSLKVLGISRKNLVRNIFIGVVSTFPILIGMSVLVISLEYLGFNDLSNVERKLLDAPDYVMVMAVTLSPVSEELFFRGLLFPVIGAMPSSIIFAVSHAAYDSLTEILAALFVGYAYCWLYRKTGSLIPPIVSHAVFNAISLLVARNVT